MILLILVLMDDKAGAFGIGKSAPFSNSYYRLIFYRTYNQKYERAAQGISRLMSYQNGALMTSGIGYYGEAEGNNPVEAIPELDSVNKQLGNRNYCGIIGKLSHFFLLWSTSG